MFFHGGRGRVVASVTDEGWATEPFLSFRATTWGSQVCYVQQIGRAGGGRRLLGLSGHSVDSQPKSATLQ